MRIYISIDMEGIPGTWNWDQEQRDRNGVKQAIFDHTRDVLSAIKDSPQNDLIEEIVIADSHGMCDNLNYSITKEDRRVNLISGAPRPFYMMPAFSKKFDMVFFLGYHAGGGRVHGNMDHTYSEKRFHSLKINGIPMNESMINAAYASLFEVPVTLITGDLALKMELQERNVLQRTEFVVTKEGISRFAVKNYSALAVSEETKAKVKKALAMTKEESLYYRIDSPVKLSIECSSTSVADVAALIPHTKRIDGLNLEFIDESYDVVFEAIVAFATLAESVKL
jgi:D-amino peptidase